VQKFASNPLKKYVLMKTAGLLKGSKCTLHLCPHCYGESEIDYWITEYDDDNEREIISVKHGLE
jgi:hypothetical protein